MKQWIVCLRSVSTLLLLYRTVAWYFDFCLLHQNLLRNIISYFMVVNQDFPWHLNRIKLIQLQHFLTEYLTLYNIASICSSYFIWDFYFMKSYYCKYCKIGKQFVFSFSVIFQLSSGLFKQGYIFIFWNKKFYYPNKIVT